MVLYDNATQIKSTHYDARPNADDVSLLVIHNISLPPFHPLFLYELSFLIFPFVLD